MAEQSEHKATDHSMSRTGDHQTVHVSTHQSVAAANEAESEPKAPISHDINAPSAKTQRIRQAVEQRGLPGVTVDPDTFVVLHSRLGRKAVALPKIDPNDPTEKVNVHVPEAFERGDVITKDDIDCDAPAHGYANNLERLLKNGAIGRMDHPDAATAVHGLQERRALERKALRERGIGAN